MPSAAAHQSTLEPGSFKLHIQDLIREVPSKGWFKNVEDAGLVACGPSNGKLRVILYKTNKPKEGTSFEVKVSSAGDVEAVSGNVEKSQIIKIVRAFHGKVSGEFKQKSAPTAQSEVAEPPAPDLDTLLPLYDEKADRPTKPQDKIDLSVYHDKEPPLSMWKAGE